MATKKEKARALFAQGFSYLSPELKRIVPNYDYRAELWKGWIEEHPEAAQQVAVSSSDTVKDEGKEAGVPAGGKPKAPGLKHPLAVSVKNIQIGTIQIPYSDWGYSSRAASVTPGRSAISAPTASSCSGASSALIRSGGRRTRRDIRLLTFNQETKSGRLVRSKRALPLHSQERGAKALSTQEAGACSELRTGTIHIQEIEILWKVKTREPFLIVPVGNTRHRVV